jgi:hypothetical protein
VRVAMCARGKHREHQYCTHLVREVDVSRRVQYVDEVALVRGVLLGASATGHSNNGNEKSVTGTTEEMYP